MGEMIALAMLPMACLVLLTGYPAAFVLGGLAVLFAIGSWLAGIFDIAVLAGTSLRLFGLMSNQSLVAIPLFIFMGMTLERAHLARGLLFALAETLGNRPGGLSLAVVLCGGLMAASTGVAGASIMTLGLIAMPVLMEAGYNQRLAAGTVAASGTLGQLIPPSIALVILTDSISASHQEAQLELGNFAPIPVSVVDVFAAALIPGVLLVLLYLAGLWLFARLQPMDQPAITRAGRSNSLWREALPLAILILVVLGSIFAGLAAPGEGAALGAAGAVALALLYRRLNLDALLDVGYQTVVTTGVIFMIIIGASMFSLVFRELGGAELIERQLHDLPGGIPAAIALGMVLIFVLGFFLEFIEIVVLIVPLLATPLFLLGVDPLWLAVLIAINIQTSFLTPPLGIALFYLRGVAPKNVTTLDIYGGAVPFIFLQLLLLGLVATFPGLATFFPQWIAG